MAHPHPLLLPNVLHHIFTLFPSKELHTLRLVNLDWNHAACTVIQNKEIISFKSLNELKSYIPVFSSSKKIRNSFPHSIYKLHYQIVENYISDISTFIKTFQPFIRNVSVTLGIGFLTVDDLKFILENLPFLEVLGLLLYYFESPRLNSSEKFEIPPLPLLKGIQIDIGCYEMSWSSATKLLLLIFDSAPNLSKIFHPMFYFPTSKCRIPSKMNLFLTDLILDDDSSEGILRRLSYLEFIIKLNDKNIKTLCNREYPLRHLFIDLWNPDEEEEKVTQQSLKALMSQLSPTLEKLSLDFPWRQEVSLEFCFQLSMKNLSSLSLNGFQGSLLRLLEKLPNLRVIELSQLDLYEILPSAQNYDLYPNVLSLRLDFCSNQTPGILSRFSRIFPILRKLDVNHATNEVARMVFQKMLSLTSLRFHGDELTDEGICGIPGDEIKTEDLITCSLAEGDALRKYTFIGNLPSLRYLKLDAYQLTEACIQHGIVHCTSLHFVSMDTRVEQSDPETTITRTFKLAEYGRNLQGKDAMLILQEEPLLEDDENAEHFFRKYEGLVKGMATDLLFA